MVTVYHNLDLDVAGQLSCRQNFPHYVPTPGDLELVAIVPGTGDLADALTLTEHEDGEAWTAGHEVLVIGGVRGKRSSREGDVFVSGEGMAHLAVPGDFRPLPELRLPFLADDGPTGC